MGFLRVSTHEICCKNFMATVSQNSVSSGLMTHTLLGYLPVRGRVSCVGIGERDAYSLSCLVASLVVCWGSLQKDQDKDGERWNRAVHCNCRETRQ